MERRGLMLTRRQAPPADAYIIAALTVAALYYGQALFIPLALAMLLAFAMTPGISWLRRRGLPKLAAAFLMLAVFLSIFAGVGGIIGSQVGSLIEDLPTYERTLREKIATIKTFGASTGSMDRAGETLKNLQEELGDAPKASPDASSPQASPFDRIDGQLGPPAPLPSAPVPVEIKQPPMTPVDQMISGLKFIASPLGTVGIVLLFLVFILVERESLRDRLIRVLGKDDVERSTTALNDTAGRLSKYMSTLFLLNLSFGVFIGLGLWIIGVPGAALWGLIAGLMRFVPFIGSIIAGLFPVMLAASVDPGWSMALLTLGLFVVAEPLMGHVIEPVVQGRATGLSMLAILVATAFWTLLWGPVGLLLAVPLTLVLVSFGKHLEPLAVFSFLLGDEPSLSPAEKFYQRILSGDAEDAVAQAEEHLETMDLAEYYDAVVRGALGQAARDFERKRFDAARLAAINESVIEVADLLAERDDEDENEDDLDAEEAVTKISPVVVCIGARTPIDDAGAHVLAHLLIERGVNARIVPPHDWRAAAALSPAVVCVGGFSSHNRLGFAARVASKACRGAEIVACKWADDAAAAGDSVVRSAASAFKSASTFEAAADEVVKIVDPSPPQHQPASETAAA
jgi:predicted PurR-regulated permease PerM